MAHEIDAPAFLSVRLLGDLTGHDDNRSLAKCYTITCFHIFLQHRPNDAECIRVGEFVWGEWMGRGSDNVRNGRGGQGQLKHEENLDSNLRVAEDRRRARMTWDAPNEAGYIRPTVCYRCGRRENRRRVEDTRGDVNCSFRDVGRLRAETVRLLGELALAEMGVAEGGIRMVLWLLIDSMGQEVAI